MPLKDGFLNDIVMYPLLYLILCLFYQKFTPQLARIINEVENTFDTLTKHKKNGFKKPFSIDLTGASGRNRTADLLITNQ